MGHWTLFDFCGNGAIILYYGFIIGLLSKVAVYVIQSRMQRRHFFCYAVISSASILALHKYMHWLLGTPTFYVEIFDLLYACYLCALRVSALLLSFMLCWKMLLWSWASFNSYEEPPEEPDENWERIKELLLESSADYDEWLMRQDAGETGETERMIELDIGGDKRDEEIHTRLVSYNAKLRAKKEAKAAERERRIEGEEPWGNGLDALMRIRLDRH